MSKTDNDQKINNLVQRLTELRFKREKIIEEEDSIHTELLFLSSTHQQTTKPKKTIGHTSIEANKLDSQGNVIYIGDTVKFLTPTKFAGSKGTVHSFSPHQVTSLTADKRKVVKSSHNLTIIQKGDQSTKLPQVQHGNHCKK